MPMGIVVTMLYSTSVYSTEKDNEEGERERESWRKMLSAAFRHLGDVVTLPHYVLF